MDIVYRYDPSLPITNESPTMATEALERLTRGSRQFAEIVAHLQKATLEPDGGGKVIIPVNLVSMGVPFIQGHMPVQNPFAIVLSCSDARAPVEQVLDCAANELFSIRVAGNVLGLECLGSVDYAVAHLADSLRVAVVLGHTGCGAVTAAVDMYLAPNEFMNVACSHAVRSLVDRISLAVRAASQALDEVRGTTDHDAPGYREQLIDAAVFVNAAVTAFDLNREIRGLSSNEIAVVYSVYDLGLCHVSCGPLGSCDPTGAVAFCPAPETSDELYVAARNIAQQIVEAKANA